MVEVGGHLHGELAALGETPGESREEGRVIGKPLQRGVREHQIDRRVGSEGGDVGLDELEPRLEERVAGLEHRRRIVDADGTARAELPVQLSRQLAGSASEVDDPHVGSLVHQCQQVEPRLRALRLEPLVLVGTPGIRAHAISADVPRCRRYMSDAQANVGWPANAPQRRSTASGHASGTG